jgi:hypothetical protein
MRILAANPDTGQPEMSVYDRWKTTQIDIE